MNKKLFCTFTSYENLNELLDTIKTNFIIKQDKIFILKTLNTEEYVCTYNIEGNNTSNFIDNTILVHRKKDTNTLYTINALNEVVKWLNGGIVDHSVKIDWTKFKNTILLTDNGGFKKIKTKLHKIETLS